MLWAATAAVVSLVRMPVALAEESTEAAAQRLFLEGRSATERGDRATACAKFAESLKLLRRAGTLMNLAQCEEDAGRLSGALDYWNQSVALLEATDDRMALAKQRRAALEARVPRLAIRLQAGTPAENEVRVDGTPLAAGEIGVSRWMEPGKHEVVFTVEGHPEQRLSVVLAEGESREVLLQVGGVADPQHWRGADGASRAAPSGTGGAGETGGRRTLGFVIGGVGLAGAVAAGVTGGLIMGRDGDIEAACAGGCTPAGRELIEGSNTLLVMNGISWGVAAVGLGVGGWLVLTGGKDSATTTAVQVLPLPGGAALALKGSF
ncbi:Hypothetical protein CAP_5075 [Chondromyces apiculatus DSM 436]|uniref:PEGA domain-containing protein n=1 Tax=Chondromyces apiculatus DSM 436 TaxID=1192034 RepID=A0A017T400_9BACT|nr:Hypothetical protein CAP_5075 [Chondromyces apiculatus DSM 436]